MHESTAVKHCGHVMVSSEADRCSKIFNVGGNYSHSERANEGMHNVENYECFQ